MSKNRKKPGIFPVKKRTFGNLKKTGVTRLPVKQMSITSPPQPLRRRAAIRALGNDRALFRQCEAAGWIKPVVNGLYDIKTIEAAWARLCKGEKPTKAKGARS